MRTAIAILGAALFAAPGNAAPEGYFSLKPGVTLETGETWLDDGQRYRLYGVQSCLRGTLYTDKAGHQRDCGEASMAVFAAYIKDTAPICAPVVRSGDLTYVMCYATVGAERLDLGSLLITSGYAFAALTAEGLPYHSPYSVYEQQARDSGIGLWQFEDVQHPSILLSSNANARQSEGR
jgi:endonuclease YncB( thermonuclease family)